jgi:hypothetical protein
LNLAGGIKVMEDYTDTCQNIYSIREQVEKIFGAKEAEIRSWRLILSSAALAQPISIRIFAYINWL